jgi:predicted nucleic-acid-binding Zn-ribbon protein
LCTLALDKCPEYLNKYEHSRQCDFLTATTGTLAKHIKAMHKKILHKKCPHCDYTSAFSGELSKHIKAV